MPSLTNVEKSAKDWLLQEGHAEGEIVRRYGKSPSFYVLKDGLIVKAFEPKLIYGLDQIFLSPNELEELRTTPYPTEILVFRKNSPLKPVAFISIDELKELTNDIDVARCEGFEIRIMPDQMLVRDKKVIKTLNIVPKSVMSNVRLIYEIGDARLQSRFLRLLQGCLRELSLETLNSDEAYKAEVEKILAQNREVLAQRQMEEEIEEDVVKEAVN